MMEEAKKRKVGPRLVLPSRNSLPGESSDKEDEDVKDNIFKETKKKNDKVKVNPDGKSPRIANHLTKCYP